MARLLLARDLAAGNLDEIDARHVLRAFLAGGALLDEGDVAVDALHLDVPQGLADGFRLRLAGCLDRGRDGVNAIPSAEALGQTADVMLLLVPERDEALGDVGVLHGFRKPRREEHEVVGVVGSITGLLDELVGRVGTARGDDARLDLLVLCLLEDQRDLLDRRGDEQRVAARRLDLGKLCREVGGLGIHRLRHADLHARLFGGCRELLRGAEAEVVVGGEEVGLLDVHLLEQRGEGLRFHLRRRADAEDIGIARGGDLAGRRGLDQHRHLVLFQLRHDGERQRRAPGTEHHRHLLARDELFGGGNGFRRVGLVVLDDELELLAEHAARLVDLLLGDLGALSHVVAGRSEGAGERLRDADLDGVLCGGCGSKERRAQHRQCCFQCTKRHIDLPFDETHSSDGAAASQAT
jgi:hypothetical protein